MGVVWNALAVERDRESFIQAGPVPRVFVSGVAYCNLIDGLLHVVYFVRHPCAQGVESLLELELVMPAAEIPTARMLVNGALESERLTLHG